MFRFRSTWRQIAFPSIIFMPARSHLVTYFFNISHFFRNAHKLAKKSCSFYGQVQKRCPFLCRAPLRSVMIGVAVPFVASDRAISPPFPSEGGTCICKLLPLPLGLPISEGARRKNHNILYFPHSLAHIAHRCSD